MSKKWGDAQRDRLGVFVFFFLCGLVMGLWAAGLPSLNDRLDLGPARLGTVLLLISGGALVSMLAAGPLVHRWSSRAVCWSAGPFSAVVLLGPALAPNYPVLAVLAVGAAGGPVGRALALVTAFGYSGLLIGPAVLGYVAEASSLPIALIVPAVLAAVVALTGAPAICALDRVATPLEPATVTARD